MFLKWFKRKEKKKDQGIVGKITETVQTRKGLLGSPVTLLSLITDNGRTYRMAMNDHVSEPKAGDRVRVFLGHSIANSNETRYEKRGDGSMERVENTTRWFEIIQYKILDEK